MEQKQYNGATPPNSICCNKITKTKQYVNLLYIESNRLSTLENDCNNALDQFYYLKREIHSYIYETLQLKLFNSSETDETGNTMELINEFSNFTMSVLSEGTKRFLQNAHTIQYGSVIDKQMTVVTSVIMQHVEEIHQILTQVPCHPCCVASLYTMCTEITNELIPRMSTADACLRQYIYLVKSIFFLKELKEIIELYIIRPCDYTVNAIYKEMVLGIPPNNELWLEDTEDVKPFRYVVDLLSGKLLDEQTLLHQHSEIKPVISDDDIMKPDIVTETVNWILQKNQLMMKKEQNLCKRIESLSKFTYCEESQNNTNQYSSTPPSNLSCKGLMQNQLALATNENKFCIPYVNTQLYEMGCNDGTTVPIQNKTGKRGRKLGSTKQSPSILSSDLQPIKIPKLKFDLFIEPLA